MPTIEATSTAAISRTIRVQLDDSEHIDTDGDRRPGTSNRRPARIVGFYLHFSYSPTGKNWRLDPWASTAIVEQQRNDQTWSDPQNRVLARIDGYRELAQPHLPTDKPSVTW